MIREEGGIDVVGGEGGRGNKERKKREENQ